MKIIKLAAMTCLSVFVVVNGVIQTATIADESQRQIGYGRGGKGRGWWCIETFKGTYPANSHQV